jgi:WD40 repeat protein
MVPGPRSPRLRRIALVAVAMVLVAIAWSASARDPVFRDPDSRWIPLAYSPDGQVLAAADATGAKRWWNPQAGGPIHRLRATDLAPVGPPVEVPTITLDPRLIQGPSYPTLEAVEFSPDGQWLAVLQGDHTRRADMLELLLIRLPGGEIARSIAIPCLEPHRPGGIAHRFFSGDGRLLAWHELALGGRGDIVRVWGVAEGRERFAIEGVVYPVLSPDGRWLATVEKNPPREWHDIACWLYDTRNGQLVHSLPLPGDVRGWQPWPEFSPDGRLLVVNVGSSRGNGESVVVFDVASGKDVFRAREWSSHFVGGSMLVTVKDDTVQFRATDTWQIRAQATFSLGRHWDNGAALTPEPQPVPGRAAVLVYDYYPTPSDRLGALRSHLHLEPEPGHWASWVDAMSGSVISFAAHRDPVWRTVMSPRGDRLAAGGSRGLTIWELPPRRSWVPTAAVAGLLALIWGVWTVICPGIAARARRTSREI